MRRIPSVQNAAIWVFSGNATHSGKAYLRRAISMLYRYSRSSRGVTGGFQVPSSGRVAERRVPKPLLVDSRWLWWMTMLLVDSRRRARVLVDSSSIFFRLLFWWMLSEVSTAILSGWYLVSVWLCKPLAYLAWVCHSRAGFFLGCCGFSTLTSGLVHTRLAVAA